MSSLPPVLPAGQQRKRNSALIILVATMMAIFVGTMFLWPAVSSTGRVPAILRSIDVQTGENPSAAPLFNEVLPPAVNPELRIQERFRANRFAAAGPMLYDNPELKTLDFYARPAQPQSADAAAKDSSVPRYEFPDYMTSRGANDENLPRYEFPDYASP
ncbi:MAG: hypothetical protein R3293_22435 [Candidatus Promineifilaceae bacterium]|nr:hypothetical protein [Candidatus Promineifilaceae bacterium]